jgi:hypothetical protein
MKERIQIKLIVKEGSNTMHTTIIDESMIKDISMIRFYAMKTKRER